ncbi:hypothetical protein XA68_14839 [Ophiocordyceps unilateralis]|uniref:Zn(2)-C6 fungal-type domain-containing protein n=1 Tax=Ophiocordyceps unilateralis TaxID=268505 RepID=A0A2A9PMS0_OPHUN|nr:hypothetical protein XA68_14839 [Ophiocordyceps unilateralis]
MAGVTSHPQYPWGPALQQPQQQQHQQAQAQAQAASSSAGTSNPTTPISTPRGFADSAPATPEPRQSTSPWPTTTTTTTTASAFPRTIDSSTLTFHDYLAAAPRIVTNQVPYSTTSSFYSPPEGHSPNSPSSPAPSSSYNVISCHHASFESLSPPLHRTDASSRKITNTAMSARRSKRAAYGGANSDRSKLPRTDTGHPDYSGQVRGKWSLCTRTGQACDRCKIRKIRCDALPDGCSQCSSLGLPCFVTDRVTRRTERRGYLQDLERQKDGMLAHIDDLGKLLRDKGVEVVPWPYENADESNDKDWTQFGSVRIKHPALERWESRPDQGHLGVGPDSAPLSSVHGTKLSLLGTTIDTMSFDAPDVDEPGHGAHPGAPLYNKSVQAFLQSCMRVNPPIQPGLPSRDEAFNLADNYFLAIASFMPVLHKPSFLHLLTRIYDEPGFQASLPIAQLVILHMVFATVYFHYAVRNCHEAQQRCDFTDLSNRHYHFALGNIYHLLSSQELVAIQALALISLHTRAFPKPGCGSIVASMALHRALELRLHRASEKKPERGTNLHYELRKRSWWAILTVVVAINGRRGYPIPVSVQDFDAEFPEPIADELLSEQGVDTSRALPCDYPAGLAGFKIVPLFMTLYANIYSVRRDARNYVSAVNDLERKLRIWEAELPDSLTIDPTQAGLERASVEALYTRLFGLELRLCLRHPSVAMTTDRDMMAENTRICEETAREFLLYTKILYKRNSLDTTWYQMSVYGVCIFSMLVPLWERRCDTSPEEVSALREDMRSWMTIVAATSKLLGCGPGINNQIGQIIETTISCIERDMRKDATGDKSPLPASIKQEEQLPTAAAYCPGAKRLPSARPKRGSKGFYQESVLDDQPSASAVPPHLAYGDQPQSNAATAAAAAAVAAATAAYPSEQQSMFYGGPPTSAVVANDSAQANVMPVYVAPLPPPPQHMAPPPQPSAEMMWQATGGGGSPWHDWTNAMADCQERYSANALLSMGQASVRGPASTPASMPTPRQTPALPDRGGAQSGDELGGQWPLSMSDYPLQEDAEKSIAVAGESTDACPKPVPESRRIELGGRPTQLGINQCWSEALMPGS